MGALADYCERRFGQRTRATFNPVVAACAATATVLLRNNPDRLAAIIVNMGANAMYLAWDQDVGITHGIYVAAGGGAVNLIADEDGELVGYELLGAAPAGAVDILVVEVEAE